MTVKQTSCSYFVPLEVLVPVSLHHYLTVINVSPCSCQQQSNIPTLFRLVIFKVQGSVFITVS